VSGEVDGRVWLPQVSVDRNEVILLRTSWTALIQAVNVKCTISLEVTEAKVAGKAEKWWRFGIEMQRI